jgi:hypothetical protein
MTSYQQFDLIVGSIIVAFILILGVLTIIDNIHGR